MFLLRKWPHKLQVLIFHKNLSYIVYIPVALQADNQQKIEELMHKEHVIQKLQKTIESMKANHKREVDELHIEQKHKTYLNQNKPNNAQHRK